jgi:hypothetical protein
MSDKIEVIHKTTFCDLTRFTNLELSWRLENFTASKPVQSEFELAESIKM